VMQHMAPLQMSSMVHSANNNSTASRSYQQSPVDMQQMPIYPATSLPGQISFQQTGYAFDMSTMNHYAVPQQQFNVNFQPAPVATPTSYAPNPNDMPAPVSLVRDARNAVPALSRSPPVKSEAPSPIQTSPHHREHSIRDSSQSATSESGEGVASIFSTEIDCLMRTIQAKQPAAPIKASRPTAPRPQRSAPEQTVAEPTTATDTRVKPRKRYLCSEPGCNKTFFQKTHLEIHTRAHTGYKPFVRHSHFSAKLHSNIYKVCKAPDCGQRFSQLGNLKVKPASYSVCLPP